MFFEESLIFLPSKFPAGDWAPVGLEFEDAWFKSADGVRLHGWYCPHPSPRAFVLFAHGNAGNLSHRAPVLRLLRNALRASVMIFDYRGYGRSEGRPNETGVCRDAIAARDWLARREGTSAEKIVLMGRSIGGAVIVDLAAREGARALVLESTFTTLPDVAAVHYPWAPVRRLLRTRFNSLEKIPRFAGPLLQSHGDADEVVPYELGRRLFEAAVGPKQFVTIPGGDHNGPPDARYLAALDSFLESLGR
jgi:hypothetical protein